LLGHKDKLAAACPDIYFLGPVTLILEQHRPNHKEEAMVTNLRPAQAGVVPLQTPQQGGFDFNSIMNVMLTMMVFMMPLQMMSGTFGNERKKKAVPALVRE
jgi:hypothetical protein